MFSFCSAYSEGTVLLVRNLLWEMKTNGEIASVRPQRLLTPYRDRPFAQRFVAAMPDENGKVYNVIFTLGAKKAEKSSGSPNYVDFVELTYDGQDFGSLSSVFQNVYSSSHIICFDTLFIKNSQVNVNEVIWAQKTIDASTGNEGDFFLRTGQTNTYIKIKKLGSNVNVSMRLERSGKIGSPNWSAICRI